MPAPEIIGYIFPYSKLIASTVILAGLGSVIGFIRKQVQDVFFLLED